MNKFGDGLAEKAAETNGRAPCGTQGQGLGVLPGIDARRHLHRRRLRLRTVEQRDVKCSVQTPRKILLSLPHGLHAPV